MDNLEKLVNANGGYGKIPHEKLSILRKKAKEMDEQEQKQRNIEKKKENADLVKRLLIAILKEFNYDAENKELLTQIDIIVNSN